MGFTPGTWGSGGRRFKSCHPDQYRLIQTFGLSKSVRHRSRVFRRNAGGPLRFRRRVCGRGEAVVCLPLVERFVDLCPFAGEVQAIFGDEDVELCEERAEEVASGAVGQALV